MLRSADGEHDACWGAYVGMPEEILVSAKLKDVVDDIERVRSAAPVRMAGSSIV